MECNPHCPLGFALLAIPLLRVVDSQLQQSIAAQLPWWLWLIIIFLSLTAIFWWQLFLRPSQAKEVQELEHHLGHGHENHHPPGLNDQDSHTEMSKPALYTSKESVIISEPGPNVVSETSDADEENPLLE